jgi:GxxExxY protein
MLIDAPFNATTQRILNAAIEVHRTIGPGLLESAYVECLEVELTERKMRFERQRIVPIFYKGRRLVTTYRADLIVEDLVIVEVKSMATTLAIHEAQVITYLKLTGHAAGLLINFNVPRLMDGVKRLINGHAQRSTKEPSEG